MKKYELSPMMKHYKNVKNQYEDCIVFYRLGDFYEMFFDDAIKASKILDLTLTGRDCGLEERAPMCGVPYHAADEYIAKLVAVGEKVAICEQLTLPQKGVKIVERDVVKIVTAGTVTNDELIDNRKNNFLASVYLNKDVASLSWADITTGEFFCKQFEDKNFLSDLSSELVKISPSEIIGNNNAISLFNNSPLVTHEVLPKFANFVESEFDYNIALSTIQSQLGVINVESFGLTKDSFNVCSAGALIAYLKETQRHALLNIKTIKVESNKNYMMLDSNVVRNLELVKTIQDGKRYGSLLWLLDKTKTSMGARKLQNVILFPLQDKSSINDRLESVEYFYNNTLVRESLSQTLSAMKDISRLSGKISNGNLMPPDCNTLRDSLALLPNIKFSLLGCNCKLINQICDRIADFTEIVKYISSTILDNPKVTLKDGGYIRDGYNAELDELRLIRNNSKDYITKLELEEREKTGIKTLKIKYNRLFGYFIEVTNSFKDKIPYEYIRRQTIANAERYVTEELKNLESKIFSAEEQSISIESKIYEEIQGTLSARIDDLKNTAEAIADLDVLLSFAIVARQNGYVKPEIVDKECALNVVDGRHPVVEYISKQKFVPNDCFLDSSDNRTMIITGPNMAGKSTYMRQIALITLMAHIGSFVPCKRAEIPLTDKIFTRVGASDSLISDRSTFMVEMSEMADIINNATSNSLIVLDEIGRGTSTYDGLSIAWSIVEFVTQKIKAKTLFATHYHELTELEAILPGVKNYKVTIKELQSSIVFVRKIMRGGTNKSFGIEVAELAGVSKDITLRAKQLLKSLEKNRPEGLSNIPDNEENLEEKKYSEVEKIIYELDLNNLSPMQAFNILTDLQEKIKD